MALLTETTVTRAAAACRVGESTLYKWLGDRSFRMALAQAEGEAVAATARKLTMLAESALNVLADVLADTQAPPAVRVRACETILGHLLRYREITVFEARLNALEQEIRGDSA